MKNQEQLILSQTDFQKISSLLDSVRSQVADLLEEELARASVVEDERLPADVVSMHSRVKFLDEETGKESTLTLVFPHEADIDAGKVSVFAPVGAALLGLRAGQAIRWLFPHGKERSLRVVAVMGAE